MVEYALVLCFIAIVSIVTIKALSTQTVETFNTINNGMISESVSATVPVEASH